ncbi:MAG: pentapeptide repeat-containing protein [Bacteroidota bacterium]
MDQVYITDRLFEKTDFSANGIEKGDYDNCTFKNCNFSEADLSAIKFSDCTFTGCNLTMARIAKTSFREARFNSCKLLGLHFENCSEFLFSVDFEDCNLNLSSFFSQKIRNTRFKNCSLHEADFTESDLTGSVFENCDLARATFDRTLLGKTDFRTAFNYSIDPEKNRIRKARFSAAGIAGLLDKYDIVIE